jgi:hypothetical protein
MDFFMASSLIKNLSHPGEKATVGANLVFAFGGLAGTEARPTGQDRKKGPANLPLPGWF